jgi:hypothetical protein
VKAVLVLIGLFVAFVPGAALFDEHAAARQMKTTRVRWRMGLVV